MPTDKKIKKIRAAIVVTPADDPAKVANIAIGLTNCNDFDLKIVGCAIPSLFDLPAAGPMIGMPVPAFAAKQYLKRVRVEIQNLCNNIIVILDKGLTDDVKPEFGYIDGPLNQIVPTLVSMFDVVVMPHSLKLPTRFRLWRPALDSLIIKSKKATTLFYVDTSTCRRIIVAQIGVGISFQNEQILSHLTDSLGVPAYRWSLEERTARVRRPESETQTLPGISDSSEIDDESVLAEQFGTWLALPNAVTLAFFKYWKVRSMLSDWRGNLIVLP